MNKPILFAGLAAAIIAYGAVVKADEYKKCFITPADQVGFKDDLIGAGPCEAACKATDGCIAWTYQPHSFEPKTMPGQCKLISKIFKEEDSEKVYCGKL